MKAIINGIELTGTPSEIFEYKLLETRAEAEALRKITVDCKLQSGPGVAETISEILNHKAWSHT